MFFPEKIKSIKDTDKVLEIGPGGTPHLRSDVFLELYFKNENEHKIQRGGTDALVTNKPVIYYSGKQFPFADNEFDYVICSHVLEHVENIELFLSEMFRVASKGYLEYPTIYYEYLYNFSVHLNLLKYHEGGLLYCKKEDTFLDEFKNVQNLFYYSLEKGCTEIINDLREYMFEGYEWTKPFQFKRTKCINDLLYTNYDLPHKNNNKILSVKQRIMKCFKMINQ